MIMHLNPTIRRRHEAPSQKHNHSPPVTYQKWPIQKDTKTTQVISPFIINRTQLKHTSIEDNRKITEQTYMQKNYQKEVN